MTTIEMLNKDVSELVDERKGFSYLPWAVAWKMVLEIDDKAILKVDRNSIDGLQCFGNPEMGYTVYTSLTFQGVTRECYLPIFEGKKSIKNPTTFDINTAVQRCKVKNIAMFGLGLNVYIGEDVPPIDYKDSDSEPKKKHQNELESYNKSNVGGAFVDPLDAPAVEPIEMEVLPAGSKVVNNGSDSVVVEKKIEPVVSEIDKELIIKMKEKKYSKKKQDDILSNDQISDELKRMFIDGRTASL